MGGPLVKRLRLRPLTAASPVRVWYGSPNFKVGAYSAEVPPVPIPNTVVKLSNVDDTWLVTTWENKTVPAFIFLNSSVGRARDC